MIVVGGGLAGLVTATEIADASKRVILLDQEGGQSLGGQVFWSFGGLFLVNSPEQRRLGIKDSCDLALQDWMGTAGVDRKEDLWPGKRAEARRRRWKPSSSMAPTSSCATARPHCILDPEHGPLIAVKLNILIRTTLGGFDSDLDDCVFGKDGKIVDGLYPAGEAAGFGGGGMHGHRSLEGTFLGDCLFSGRNTGRAAAKAVA